MSYDLTIRPNATYSEFKPIAPLDAFLAAQPHVKPNGPRSYVLEEGNRWMQIYIETVSDEGDNIEDDPFDPETYNCIRAHIPYRHLGENPEKNYFLLLQQIAEHVGWPLRDEQCDDDESEENAHPSTKPWWKFW